MTPTTPEAEPEAGSRTDAADRSLGPDSPATTLGIQEFAAELRGLRGDFDKLLPHVASALKRNEAHEELVARLERAERRLEARRERPMALSVHRVLNGLRHWDFDPKAKMMLDHELGLALRDAGFNEFGDVGDRFDPAVHEVLGNPPRGADTVVAVHDSGLAAHGEVFVRARVELGTLPDDAPQRRHDT